MKDLWGFSGWIAFLAALLYVPTSLLAGFPWDFRAEVLLLLILLGVVFHGCAAVLWAIEQRSGRDGA